MVPRGIVPRSQARTWPPRSSSRGRRDARSLQIGHFGSPGGQRWVRWAMSRASATLDQCRSAASPISPRSAPPFALVRSSHVGLDCLRQAGLRSFELRLRAGTSPRAFCFCRSPSGAGYSQGARGFCGGRCREAWPTRTRPLSSRPTSAGRGAVCATCSRTKKPAGGNARECGKARSPRRFPP